MSVWRYLKNEYLYYLIITLVMAVSCNNLTAGDRGRRNKKVPEGWFNAGEWRQGWKVLPDELMDRREFTRQYFHNPGRWNKAFAFLKEMDLANLAPGRYELDGTDLYVNVDEYPTKDEENSRFESHRKYADIQYLVFGEERIGVTSLENTEVISPYDEDKDICFFKGRKK